MSSFGNEVSLIACRFCDQIYPNATTLMRHFLDNECINMPQFGNEPQNPNEVSFTVCQFCDQICSDVTGLMRHFIYDKCPVMAVSSDGKSLIPRYEAYENVINSVHLTVSFINKTQLFFMNPCPRFHGLPPQNVPLRTREPQNRVINPIYRTRPFIKKLEKPIPEIIVIQDDDEDEEMKLDLTLKF